MILTFTQGIVTHSTASGVVGDTPNFLVIADTGAKVNLNASIDQKFQQAFAQRTANYLLTIREDSPVSAWGYNGDLGAENAAMVDGEGGGQAGSTFYLFIDIDKATGKTAYGWSAYEPATGDVPPDNLNPENRPDGQHWFNTKDDRNTMNRWRANEVAPNYGSWVEKVRCFVAEYTFNATFDSMSYNSPSFIGTTVGLDNGSYRVGSLIFDLNENVVKRTDSSNINLFFTTEDVFGSGLPTSSRTRLESFIVDGIAQVTVTAYQAVYFSKLNELRLLSTDKQDDSIFGIVEVSALSGELVKVTTSGVINNSAWNWSDVNQQIFIDKDQPGILTTVEDDNYVTAPNQKPIAVAIDATTILLRSSELVLTSNAEGSGVNDFLALEDTPSSYTGQANKIVKVNDTANVLEFGAEMSNLDDVDITGIALGNALIYEGGTPAWTARFLVEADISDLDKYSVPAVDALLLGKSDVGHTHALSSLSDIDFVGSPAEPVDGDVLTYVSGSPSTWQALAPAGGGGGGNLLTDTDGDTFIDVEFSADDDVIRMPYPAVTDVMTVASNGVVIDLSTSVPFGSDSSGAGINITAGPASGNNSGYTGGTIGLYAGPGGTDGKAFGGDINLKSGAGGTSGASGGYAGTIYLLGGNGASAGGGEDYNGRGGGITIQCGNAGTTEAGYSAQGGTLTLYAGNSTKTYGGAVSIGAGQGGSTGAGGPIDIFGGYGTAAGQPGGNVSIAGGSAGGAGSLGGNVTVAGGFGPGGYGTVTLGQASHKWPNADGALGEVLTTDGSGNLSFAAAGGGGGGSSIVDADGDTSITVEIGSPADGDVIRFDTGNTNTPYPALTDVVTVASNGIALDLSNSTPSVANTNGAGIDITAGPAGGYYLAVGGAVTVSAGTGGVSDSYTAPAGGQLVLVGGYGGITTGTNSKGGGGGAVLVSGGTGGTNAGGGEAQKGGDGGDVTIQGGDLGVFDTSASTFGKSAGSIVLVTGNGYHSATPGDISLTAGTGGNTATPGGSINITAGDTLGSSGGGFQAGHINITGGSAPVVKPGSPALPAYGKGGDVIIVGGAGGAFYGDAHVKLGKAAHLWPNTDGINGQPITTDGAGTLGFNGPQLFNGTGTPEGSVTAPIGSLYTDSTGGAGTTLYVKESTTGNTGWVAK
jgi:hypothetical protein